MGDLNYYLGANSWGIYDVMDQIVFGSALRVFSSMSSRFILFKEEGVNSEGMGFVIISVRNPEKMLSTTIKNNLKVEDYLPY